MEGGDRARFPKMPARVEVIDCTLRDGEQTPGVWFTPTEKVELAKRLDLAGIDVLDAGVPASCAEEIETIQELRRLNLRSRLGATARAVAADVVAAERARAHEVFLFLPTSDLRLLGGLGMSREQAATRLRAAAEDVVARGMTLNIVAEDAYRSEPRWLVQLFSALGALPVRRFVVCDTVGAAFPAGMERLIATLRDAIDPAVTLCTHCHNDFGMATANSLAAVQAGAGAVTCTVNGIGERAGNADLAEVVAALTHLFGVEHGVNPMWLPRLSAEVDRLTGAFTTPLKPVTGSNVYSHESGVHVEAMLKDQRSYEFLPAQWTGRESRYVFGKHSGLSLVRHVFESEQVPRTDGELRRVLDAVKQRSQARAKRKHAEMYEQLRRFQAWALGGVPLTAVLQMAAGDEEPDTGSANGSFERP